MNAVQQKPFLRIPPFPGARSVSLAATFDCPGHRDDCPLDQLVDLVRELRVGGDYWAHQPLVPEAPYTLVRVADRDERLRIVQNVPESERIVCWSDEPARDERSVVICGPCDPWHLLSGAKHVIADAQDDLALIAEIAGIPLERVGGEPGELVSNFRKRVAGVGYRDPFTGERLALEAAITLCGFWRHLIDSNRDIGGAIGFAFWKRPTVAPLLWGGSDVNFTSDLEPGLAGKVAVWKARTSASVLAELEADKGRAIEVEDGFIRSAGLGADCVPPLSIVVDRLGVHFDPGRPSELEQLIEKGEFSTELVERARTLRALIVASGVSKYAAGPASPVERTNERRHILVPGQVEDDRAVLCGGPDVRGNLDLLRRVRQDSPDAYILYKPHPDVEAGHRAGGISDEKCFEFADEIVRNQPISALIDLVDEIHVNTSLAGFEALLRMKPVTTHGVPFYAGWGLTRDRGSVPSRRTAERTIDELVAAVLLQYPRYLDPLTGLPCPPEILVRRIAEGAAPRDGVVVQMRRLQGRLKKRLSGLGMAR
ncbi:MAG TPA: capsule biosynthesis protein [Sphingomicrobium sp.]|nr:capsule biosynthesis protein [Sphingomicrobium sp.]